MLHYSCDLCGHRLDEQRFVVKLEVVPAFDPDEIDEEDLDADNLQAVAEALDQMEAGGGFDVEDVDSKGFRFDLCPDCRRRYVQDPLGRKSLTRLNFSQN